MTTQTPTCCARRRTATAILARPEALRLALPMLGFALLLSTAATPAVALLEPLEKDTCDAESLARSAIVECALEDAQYLVEDAGTGVGNAPGNPTSSGWCSPGDKKTIYGDSEAKWTPLYGVNSPRQGHATVSAESAQSVEISIGFEFEGTGVHLNAAETLSQGVSLTASDGVSKVVYQLVEWSEFTKKKCKWDFNWHTVATGYKPTDYQPNGFPEQMTGELQGTHLHTDQDNLLRPVASWSTPDNTIAIDLRWQTTEMSKCAKDEDMWFGQEGVYSVGAQMSFKGALKLGWTTTRTESNSFEYHFEDGCYYIDYLRTGSSDRSGLAFHMYDATSDTGGGSECSGKALVVGAASCAGEPCTGRLPSERTVQEAACALVPGCEDLSVAVPLLCGGLPPECGEGGGGGFGEPCIPGRPEVCPSPVVSLQVDPCEPCGSVKLPKVDCNAGPPSCEELPLDACKPIPRPCSEHATGLEGELSRWVCGERPDPCERDLPDPAGLCGDPAGD